MYVPASRSRCVRSGLFEIDFGSGELHKEGRKVPLQEQPFRVLLMLLARPGEVVTREELQAQLWPADTYVSFDEGLHTAIVLACSAWRVASRVLMSDSLGSFWTIGSIAQPNPSGTSRVSDMARHSTTTPASRSSNRQ